MHKDHNSPLPVREVGKGGRQFRFKGRVFRSVSREVDGLDSPGRTYANAVANPINISSRILHHTDPVPMLPRIRKSLCSRFTTHFKTKPRRQSETNWPLRTSEELLKTRQFDPSVQLLPFPHKLRQNPCDLHDTSLGDATSRTQKGNHIPGCIVHSKAAQERHSVGGLG